MSLTRQNLIVFFRKNSIYFVGALCLLISLGAIWYTTVAIILFLITIAVCSLFFDINKMLCLCSFSVFFDGTYRFWVFISFYISATIICLKDIILKRKSLEKYYLIPAAIFAYFFLTFFIVGFDINNYKAIAQIVAMIVFVSELFFLREDLDFVYIVKSLTTVLILSYICAIPFMLSDSGLTVYHDGEIKRYYGFIVHENAISLICVLLSAFNVSLFYRKKISKILFFLFIACLLIMGVLSKSKSFMLGFLFVLIYYFVRLFIQDWKKGLVELGVLALVICALFLFAYERVYIYLSRFWLYLADTDFLNMITTGRVMIWEYVLSLWVASFASIAIGYGGSFTLAEYPNAHNAIFDVLIKHGIVGLALMVLLFILFVKKSKGEKKWDINNYFELGILGFLMMIEIFYSNVGLTMIMLVFISLFSPRSKEEQQRQIMDSNQLTSVEKPVQMEVNK